MSGRDSAAIGIAEDVKDFEKWNLMLPFDIFSMSLSADVFRKSSLIQATLSFKVGVSWPLLLC